VKARDLYQLLSTSQSGAALREMIAPAIPDYRQGLIDRELARPVDVECDGALLVIAASHLSTLCEAFLDEQLDGVEIAYIATALEVTPDFRFVSKEVEECTFLLSRAHTNVGPEAISALLRVLREHAA
jgi:hypothetical protein